MDVLTFRDWKMLKHLYVGNLFGDSAHQVDDDNLAAILNLRWPSLIYLALCKMCMKKIRILYQRRECKDGCGGINFSQPYSQI